MSSIAPLPWEALHIICEGISIIDSPQLEIRDEAEAHQFVLSYGFDLFDQNHIDYIWELYEEACRFVDHRLCSNTTGEWPSFPAVLKDKSVVGDFKKILLIASNQDVHPLLPTKIFQRWMCAILRVMHTLTHLRSDLRLKYLGKIKDQTIGRFEAHIQRVPANEATGEAEQIYLGFERDKVPLVSFHKKESKVRQSILLKLLHKPQNVTQEIYDHIGVRFITRTRFEAVHVIRYLITHHLISVANVMPARCRNTLFSLREFQDLYSELNTSELSADWRGVADLLETKLGFPDATESAENRFTALSYRSIQFTCRPLIRIPVRRVGGKRSENSFFFPFELQIMDETSYQNSLTGEASHPSYKQKQIEAVRHRVLRDLKITKA